MIRGTTPTIKFTVPDAYNPALFDALNITFSRNGQIDLEKKKADCTISGQNIFINLTEVETLKLKPGEYKYQLKFAIGTKVLASKTKIINVEDILNDDRLL